VDVSAEGVEEVVGVDLSVGVVCQKYEEPESCGSAVNFLLGVEMVGDLPGRMEVEGDALMVGDLPGRMEVEGDALMVVETDLFFNDNDSNSDVVHILADRVDDDKVDEDVLAVDDVDILLADRVDDDQYFEATTAPPVDGDQVEEEPSTAVNHDQADDVNAPLLLMILLMGTESRKSFQLNPPSHQSQSKHVQRPATSLVGGREEVVTARPPSR
jgi:hypothetical protein